MVLRITLQVKFRAFGITFGTLQREFTLPVPGYPANLLRFSERGVALSIDTAGERYAPDSRPMTLF